MGAKNFSHTHRSTMSGLKKLASEVFLESWKVLAERQRWWRRQKRTKSNKSPGYPGWLNELVHSQLLGIYDLFMENQIEMVEKNHPPLYKWLYVHVCYTQPKMPRIISKIIYAV